MVPAGVNPFDQLIQAAQLRQARPHLRPAPRNLASDTLTLTLVEHLRQAGPTTTASLCHVVDRESRLVWGLLKNRRAAGEVTFADGLWSAAADYSESLQAEIAAAAALLRRHGWMVRRLRGVRP